MMDLSNSTSDFAYSTTEVSIDDVIPDFTPTKSTKRLAKTIKNAPPRGMSVPDVVVDDSLDDLLLAFSKSTLKDRYLVEDESFQDRFANCVRYYANDADHAQRMYGYISRLWCMPATPILSNGGNTKGNLISCFLNDMPDSLKGIRDTLNENFWMGAKGGGIGTYTGGLRSIGEACGLNGKTTGAISFTKMIDTQVGTISQAGNRRGAGAAWMDMSHPEIIDHIEARCEHGDPNRRTHNLFNGVLIPDAFMEAVKNNTDWAPNWDLISPHTGKVIKTVSARELAIKLVTTRLETGCPFIMFSDRVKEATPEHHKRSGLIPHTSNLCSEITLPTGMDHHQRMRTAVCCLFQLNAEKYNEWKDHPTFIKDCMYFLDNVLQDFIDNAGEDFVQARYAASQERSVGLGVMGLHSFFQSKFLAWNNVMAKVWNKKIFKHIHDQVNIASYEIAEERGACPDAAEHGIMERFSYKTAIAPTASVSIICGGTSAGIDAIPANIYTHKTLDGSFEVRNPYLEKVLEALGKNTPDVWKDILDHEGSVQHLDFLDDETKNVFKTAPEIDQRYLVDLNADRTPYISQAQSFNLTLAPDCEKFDLWKIHEYAYKQGVKTMYYLRSKSVQNVLNADAVFKTSAQTVHAEINYNRYQECLSCQ